VNDFDALGTRELGYRTRQGGRNTIIEEEVHLAGTRALKLHSFGDRFWIYIE